jgi:hypothetical protein
MEESKKESLPIEIAAAAITLTLAALVFVTTELRVTLLERELLEGQHGVFAQRVTSLKTAVVQMDADIQSREEQIKKASATEAKYAAFLTDLLELSKLDPEARAVTQKWKIQSSGGAVAPTTGAGTAPAPESHEVTREVPKESKPLKAVSPETAVSSKPKAP